MLQKGNCGHFMKQLTRWAEVRKYAVFYVSLRLFFFPLTKDWVLIFLWFTMLNLHNVQRQVSER